MSLVEIATKRSREQEGNSTVKTVANGIYVKPIGDADEFSRICDGNTPLMTAQLAKQLTL
jgi:hypothetical protein